MSNSLPRRLAAEALGTGLLVATVVGAGLMAAGLTKDVAIQLLANAIPTGAMLIVLITIFGPVSGAHFNPAVTMVFAFRRDLPMSELGPYVAAQCLGAVAGTAVAHLMFGLAPFVIGTQVRTGPALWFAEAVATFTLIVAIMGTLRAKPDAVALVVGLTIAAAYWFTSSTSFANPAVTLARGLTTSFAGIALTDVPMFASAQLAGALVGLGASSVLFGHNASRYGAT